MGPWVIPDDTTAADTQQGPEPIRSISCDLTFAVAGAAEVVLQVTASAAAGSVVLETFDVTLGDRPPTSVVEVADPSGARMHIVRCSPGSLTVAYRARIRPRPPAAGAAAGGARADTDVADDAARHERQVYLRPSRYCPSDHLVGFAAAQFGTGPDVAGRVAAIATWIRQRIGYVPGSSTVHDSAEDTLLTGMGTCRDFAHLGIALCRATGIPARFAAVYAPGLSPMDFHAVFEAYAHGRWYVYDATGLAPRQSLVRIVTGRDAADTAFAATISGSTELTHLQVSAVVDAVLPVDDHGSLVTLP